MPFDQIPGLLLLTADTLIQCLCKPQGGAQSNTFCDIAQDKGCRFSCFESPLSYPLHTQKARS